MVKVTQRDNQFLHYTFEGQEPWEEVKLVTHPHWATLIRPFLVIVAVWLIVVFVFYFFKASWVTGYAMLGAIAFTFLYLARAFFLWYNTVTIITDHRVMQILQRALFNREVAATTWGNVTSITVFTPGVLSSTLGFGGIVIDPGGSEQIVSLYAVPNVYSVQQMALTLMRRAQEEVSGRTGEERLEKKQKSKKTILD